MAIRTWLAVSVFGALAFGLAASPALAAPCGTVGTPGACTIAVGGTVNFAFTDFSFVTNSASGGGALYDAEDIAIDVSSAGGLTAQLTFSKVLPGPVFLANAGQVSSFIFSYDVVATPIATGDIEFTSITTKLFGSVLMNGSSAVQGIVANQINCAANSADPDNTCAITGEGPLDVGEIVTLAGNSGNTSILTFTQVFEVAFTPDDDPTTSVPAPAGLSVVLAAGLGWAVLRRRRA